MYAQCVAQLSSMASTESPRRVLVVSSVTRNPEELLVLLEMMIKIPIC